MSARNKYRAKRTTVDGITFDSKKEANRWQELKLLERAGEISELRRQVAFPLWAATNSKTISQTLDTPAGRLVKIRSDRYPNGRQATYVADFVYTENGQQVVEDTKGMITPVAKLKIAIVEAMLGIRVRIT